MRLSLRIHEIENITVISCRGRIAYRDEAEALSMRASSLLKQRRALVFDLSEVRELDGAGLGRLAGLVAQANQLETPMAFCGVTGLVRELLQLTRLSSVFPIYASVDTAIKDIRVRLHPQQPSAFPLEAVAPSTLL